MSAFLPRPGLLRLGVGAGMLAVSLLVFAGCGPTSVKVTGTVMFNDKPLPGGTVFFSPAKGKANPVGAQFGEDGRFETTLTVGDYFVAVDNSGLKDPTAPIGTTTDLPQALKDKDSKIMGKPGGTKMPPKTFGPPPEALKKMKDEGKEPVAPPPIQKQAGTYVKIPEKYLHADKSGLTQTIDANTKDIKIELK